MKAAIQGLARDVQVAAQSMREEGVIGTLRRARLSHTRRMGGYELRLPDGLTPSAPLGWSATLAAISHHYRLDIAGQMQWPEREMRGDLRRLAGLRTVLPEPEAVLLIDARSDLRRTLACLESLSSWPESRTAHILILAPMEAGAEYHRLCTLAGVEVFDRSQRVECMERALLLVQGDTVKALIVLKDDVIPLPGWLDGMMFQCARPGVGMVGARIVNRSELRTRKRHSQPQARTDDVQSPSPEAWAIPASVAGIVDPFCGIPEDDAALLDLSMEVIRGGRSVRVVADALVLAGAIRMPQASGNPVAISSRPRALIAAGSVPRTDNDSGSQDIYWVIRHTLELGFDVSFLSLAPVIADEYSWELQRLGARLLDATKLRDDELQRESRIVDVHIALSAESALLLGTTRLESTSHTSQLVFLPLDLLHRSLRAQAASLDKQNAMRQPTEVLAEVHEKTEMAAVAAADLVGVISSDELTYLCERGFQRNTFLFPMLRSTPDRTQRQLSNTAPTVVFVGGFRHRPNGVSVSWFIREIWPLVRAEVADARFAIYGSGLQPALATEWKMVQAVDVVGAFLQEADPYRGATVAVAPLLFGGGVKGKVIAALGHGVPVVGTQFAAEGLPRDVQDALQIGETPVEVADRIVALLIDPVARQVASARGVAAYDQHFSVDAGRLAVQDLFDRLAVPRYAMK